MEKSMVLEGYRTSFEPAKQDKGRAEVRVWSGRHASPPHTRSCIVTADVSCVRSRSRGLETRFGYADRYLRVSSVSSDRLATLERGVARFDRATFRISFPPRASAAGRTIRVVAPHFRC